MKLSLALLATYAANALAGKTAEISEVRADSKFGMDLLSKSRRVEDNGENAEEDMSWVTGYSLKFQGCHHIAQWNADAEDDAEAVRIETRRLARFRLCPVSSCSADLAQGCKNSYGDYIVDMDTFLQTYMANKEEVDAENCENFAASSCDCADEDAYGYAIQRDDAFDAEECEYQCFKNAGMSECYESRYYNAYGYQVEDGSALDVADYMQCAQFDAGNGRKLEDGNDGGDGGYYVGPYCSDQGGKIVLGMFTDEDCTNFADDYGGVKTFESITGKSLPYGSESLVDSKCYSCAENGEENAYGYTQYEAKETCTTLYENAGKCESGLSNAKGSSNINENACTYMQGVKVTTKNNVIISGAATSNKVASAFIGIFSVSFVLLGSYVYYLKTKLDRGSINLSD